MRTTAALLVATLVLSGCGAGAKPDGPAGADGVPGCSVLADVPAPRALRARLDLGTLVAWEQVSADAASVNAVGVVRSGGGEVAGVLPELQRMLAEQGWEAFSLDDEGFEAELLLRGDDDVLLGITLREGTCPSRVDLTLSITDYAALE